MPNYNSIEGNVLFPTIDGYDMHKPGDMALYLAHCDFYPFKNVIENNKMAIDFVTKAYKDIAEEAREKDDFRVESGAMTSMTLQVCRVDILTQYSLVLTMVSLLEEAVNTLCRLHKGAGHFTTELKNIKGAGLERAAKYLKDVVGISGFKADLSWEYITTIRDCRNMVVHNGGRIKDELKPKCDKFNIGYREEDSQLYIEYADVMKFYEAILDFMDRAFRLPYKYNDFYNRSKSEFFKDCSSY